MADVYYNENHPFAAQWLKNLIVGGALPKGDVDERDIRDVAASDLQGYQQCHFFAGIGGWPVALSRARWSSDRPIWTGSCPCQPFSAAGAGIAFDDERHLWPDWHWLIEGCRPETIMGEQVASKDGLAWIDLVFDDMEGSNYTMRAVDTCASGSGAPHIRQRLYWLADANHPRSQGRVVERHRADQRSVGTNGVVGCGLADADGRIAGGSGAIQRGRKFGLQSQSGNNDTTERSGLPGAVNGFWQSADWIICNDPDGPKWRAVEPGTFPLVDGDTSRVEKIRAYGNAINIEQAADFIRAILGG